MTIQMTIQQRKSEILNQFLGLATWEERYKKIIEMGRALPDLPEELRTEEAKVKGCQSQVWLHAQLKEGRLQLQGDSDALIVKGLVALLLYVYNQGTPAEVLQTPPDFLKAMGFEGNLSPSRANGLMAMIKQIQMFAFAFQYAQNKT